MKKKFSILINTLGAGGAERVASLLLQNLESSYDITLILFTNKIEYTLPEDLKIICLNLPMYENGLLTILKLPLLAWQYKKICKKNNIETSFSFLKRPNYVNCLSKLFGNKTRIIISERAYLSEYLKIMSPAKKFIAIHLTKNIYPLADLIVPNAQLIKIDLENNFNIHTNYKVINNPINLKMIHELSRMETTLPDDAFTFINVGGFRIEKNHELLIEAFDKIKHLNVKLLFLGKGELEEKMKEKVRLLNLGSKIFFLGFDTNPFKYLSKSDCFVLSSHFEGFPNCLLEAMACGLAVISTDCLSGPREILAPETNPLHIVTDSIDVVEYGILTPVNNAIQLANAMKMLVTNKKLCDEMKAKSIERASDYSIDNIIKQFKEVISN